MREFQPALKATHADHEVTWLDVLQDLRPVNDLDDATPFPSHELILWDHAVALRRR